MFERCWPALVGRQLALGAFGLDPGLPRCSAGELEGVWDGKKMDMTGLKDRRRQVSHRFWVLGQKAFAYTSLYHEISAEVELGQRSGS